MYCQIDKPNKIKAILHAYQLNKQIHFSSRPQLAVPPNESDKEEILKSAKGNILPNKTNQLFSKFNIKEIKDYYLYKVDNSKSLPLFKKKFVEYYKADENLSGNEKSGQKKSVPVGNLLSNKTNPLLSKFNITEINNYYSNKLEKSKSLPFLRKKFVGSYQFCENIFSKNKFRLGQKGLPFLQFENSPTVSDKGSTKENKTNPSLSKANVTEMKDYYRNIIRAGQKKGLLILKRKYNEYDKVFEKYTGLDKIWIAQNKSKQAGHKLRRAQVDTRRLKNELTVIQKDLEQIKWDISKSDPDDSRYLHLVNQKNDKILDEREKLEKINIATKKEYDLFSHYSSAINKSYETESAHTKKFKILIRAIKLVVAIIGIFSIIITMIIGGR